MIFYIWASLLDTANKALEDTFSKAAVIAYGGRIIPPFVINVPPRYITNLSWNHVADDSRKNYCREGDYYILKVHTRTYLLIPSNTNVMNQEVSLTIYRAHNPCKYNYFPSP